ncbi:hypothetical protein ANN_13605 [Periplaneta americana]|uniref:Uncharacterized protein n=1 Tax=Periplaneta americana TaxID=6978 RepID=A0ABQ8TJW1_PERAM|nr:hypothetical protein ANN_13605 [Periplaneta americana]
MPCPSQTSGFDVPNYVRYEMSGLRHPIFTAEELVASCCDYSKPHTVRLKRGDEGERDGQHAQEAPQGGELRRGVAGHPRQGGACAHLGAAAVVERGLYAAGRHGALVLHGDLGAQVHRVLNCNTKNNQLGLRHMCCDKSHSKHQASRRLRTDDSFPIESKRGRVHPNVSESSRSFPWQALLAFTLQGAPQAQTCTICRIQIERMTHAALTVNDGNTILNRQPQ